MANRGSWWKFTYSEQGGIIVLAILLIILCMIKVWLIPIASKVDPISEEDLKRVLTAFEQTDTISHESKADNHVLAVEEYKGFNFNPNTITFDSLKLMGLDSGLARRYVNFRNALGGFKDDHDVRRIYGIDSHLLIHIDQWAIWPKNEDVEDRHADSILAVDLSTNSSRKRLSSESSSNPMYRRIELNSATKEELERIRGIGPVLSGRILKFRESLGGFSGVTQLFDVYGLDSANVELSSWQVLVDTQLIKGIHVNTSDRDLLARHPYINYKQARMLVNYRNQHGPFKNGKDLRSSLAFNDAEIMQLIVYLRFD